MVQQKQVRGPELEAERLLALLLGGMYGGGGRRGRGRGGGGGGGGEARKKK